MCEVTLRIDDARLDAIVVRLYSSLDAVQSFSSKLASLAKDCEVNVSSTEAFQSASLRAVALTLSLSKGARSKPRLPSATRLAYPSKHGVTTSYASVRPVVSRPMHSSAKATASAYHLTYEYQAQRCTAVVAAFVRLELSTFNARSSILELSLAVTDVIFTFCSDRTTRSRMVTKDSRATRDAITCSGLVRSRTGSYRVVIISSTTYFLVVYEDSSMPSLT